MFTVYILSTLTSSNKLSEPREEQHVPLLPILLPLAILLGVPGLVLVVEEVLGVRLAAQHGQDGRGQLLAVHILPGDILEEPK